MKSVHMTTYEGMHMCVCVRLNPWAEETLEFSGWKGSSNLKKDQN